MLINSSDSVVNEMVEGLLLSHTSIKQVEGHNVIVRADIEEVRAKQVGSRDRVGE